MQTFPDWIIKTADPQAGQSVQSNVMAWARDTVTGAPVYIGQLDKTRTGAACQCECPSCNLPLTAVNAAKAEFIKRPHFRHPDGAEKSECMYLAARMAALQLLLEQGVFQLPRRSTKPQSTYRPTNFLASAKPECSNASLNSSSSSVVIPTSAD